MKQVGRKHDSLAAPRKNKLYMQHRHALEVVQPEALLHDSRHSALAPMSNVHGLPFQGEVTGYQPKPFRVRDILASVLDAPDALDLAVASARMDPFCDMRRTITAI